MNSIRRILRRFIQVGWALRFVPWGAVRRLKKADANTVLWIHHRYPESMFRYLTKEETILKDLALVAAVAKRGQPFRIVWGNKLGEISNSKVLYSIDQYNPDGIQNYSAQLVGALNQLLEQGNEIFPELSAARLWENKVEMHAHFDAHHVNSPTTAVVERNDVASAVALDAGLEFPLLAKEPHSCNSAGIYKCSDAAELDALWSRLKAEDHDDLLVQSLVDMSSDMRVIIIGDEIVLHFMRINREKGEWQPTSIQKRSDADYENFPERWRAGIIETLHRLGLRNGAFDICWAGDDLTTEPIFLEVSPAYHPSPKPPPAFASKPYSEYMDQLTGPNSYPKAFVSTIFEFSDQALATSSIL